MPRDHSSQQERDIRRYRMECPARLDICYQILEIWKRKGYLQPGEYEELLQILDERQINETESL